MHQTSPNFRAALAVLGVIIIFMGFMVFAVAANATEQDCSHPVFVELGCEQGGPPGPPGPAGPPGADGRDGADGADGRDGADGAAGAQGEQGIQGIQGEQGIQGIQGETGMVDETWINETRYQFDRYAHYSAAFSSIQIHLPQDKGSRLTAGVGRSHGEVGFGLGYAYKWDERDDNMAFTFGVGTSGGEEAYKASLGFEFGVERRLNPSDALLERRLNALEERLERQADIHAEELAMCAAELKEHDESLERVLQRCVRK